MGILLSVRARAYLQDLVVRTCVTQCQCQSALCMRMWVMLGHHERHSPLSQSAQDQSMPLHQVTRAAPVGADDDMLIKAFGTLCRLVHCIPY